MMGSGGCSSRDSSFLCLLAIYATHVLLFHVLAVAPLMGKPAAHRSPRAAFRQLNSSALLETSLLSNDSRMLVLDPPPVDSSDDMTGDALLLTGQQFHHQVFVSSSSARSWESSMTNLINNYPKMLVDFSLLSHYFHRIKNIFTTVAWSSSTWGVISGCAIFLLTYTERENAQ